MAQNAVTATKISSTNTGNVIGSAALTGIEQISSGIGNNIGASALGAASIGNVNQSVSQSQIQLGSPGSPASQAGNTVTVTEITATNNQAPDIVQGVRLSNTTAIVTISGFSQIGSSTSLGGPLVYSGGGIGNSISANAVGASASANIVQSFDTNTQTDLTSLANNTITVKKDITATNTQGLIAAIMNPGGSAIIAGGIGNSIAAQAGGATAGAGIQSSMLDTSNTIGTGPQPLKNGALIGTNSVTTGDISATNRDAVVALFGASSGLPPVPTALIVDGIGNAIGAFASGAAANGGITQSVDFTQPGQQNPGGAFIPSTLFANSVTTGAISAFNGKNGTVTASFGASNGPGLDVSTISYGIGNTIAAEASGASATGSINQRFDNAPSIQASGIISPLGASNTLTTGSMTAVNHGNVTADAVFFSSTGSPSPLISSGIGNLIGATAVGASSGIGISQSFLDSPQIATIQINNTAQLNGSSLARNGKSATVEAIVNQIVPDQIANGVGNSIGASAVGASTGATISQSVAGTQSQGLATFMDSSSIGSNSVTVKDKGGVGHALEAVNHGVVAASYIQTNGLLNGPTALISDGVGNSISAQAAGATVNASISSRFLNTTVTDIGNPPGQVATNTVTVKGNPNDLLARNTGTVEASFAPPLGTVVGTTNNIVTGVGNFMGASASGASASAGISQSASFDSVLVAQSGLAPQALPVNTVTTGNITARNSGNVAATVTMDGVVAIGVPLPGFQTNMSAGIGNSISAQAVGASAGADISSRFYNVISNPTAGLAAGLGAANTVTTGDITAKNIGGGTPIAPTGAVVASATFLGMPSINSGAINSGITGGIANFIGASAVGASAGAGISQSVSNGPGMFAFDMTTLPPNSIQAGAVKAANSGEVVATLTASSAQIGYGVTVGSLGNIGNSISAQAVGASAAASITTQVLNVSITPSSTFLPSTSSNTVKVASLDSTNSGNVTAQANFNGLGGTLPISIGGGIGNSVGASATGASSFASINQAVASSIGGGNTGAISMNSLNTLAANSINSGPISANNSGNISATLVSTGTLGISGISGGVGNSISAVAVGASASASIVQSIANVK